MHVAAYLLLYMCPHTYYYICVLSIMVYFTLFSVGSSLNIGDRACASLTLVGIARDTDVCVRVCLCASVRVCVCVHVLTFCVCVSQAALSVSCCSVLHLLTFCVCVCLRLLCVPDLPFSPRYEVYICHNICPRSAIFLAAICPHNLFLYRYICAVKRLY
jgi:hypothetical protein